MWRMTRLCRHFGEGEKIGTFTAAQGHLFPSGCGKVSAGTAGHSWLSSLLQRTNACCLRVTACNRNGSGLQSAHFQDHIICIYLPPQDHIICD